MITLSINPLCGGLRFGAVAAETKTLKIGIDLPLSGAEAAGNIPTENGVLLAIGEAGARGLPHGYTLAPYVLDDAVEGKHDPAQGVQNVRTFIADAGVLAVVGPANSNVAKAEIPIGNDAGLVQIAASTTADELTRLYKVENGKARFVSQIDLSNEASSGRSARHRPRPHAPARARRSSWKRRAQFTCHDVARDRTRSNFAQYGVHR